jgi:hypothetical protein
MMENDENGEDHSVASGGTEKKKPAKPRAQSAKQRPMVPKPPQKPRPRTAGDQFGLVVLPEFEG